MKAREVSKNVINALYSSSVVLFILSIGFMIISIFVCPYSWILFALFLVLGITQIVIAHRLNKNNLKLSFKN
ncbi:MAG: hypothetical protein K5765_00690 [Clostridia bacterium]|nr:hypothetical protein [Clostridia bacterium]